MLVLPILGRMYNEGFRLWSAALAENASDFVSVRHVTTSSCVVMFMSHNMLELINSGSPEALAVCRSSLLRAVVLLDDARPSSRMFALTAPEQIEYHPGNDSSFWLHAYSADYLERCRGPWPEVKIELREPTFDDVNEDVIAAEYISLEKIINRGGVKPEQVNAPARYPNNPGYIQPKPDELSYEPLQKVEAAKTVHDRDFDDAIALLNQCADRQVDIIINHTRPGENTVAAKPSLSPIMPLPDSKAELRIIQQELERNEREPRPERKIEPEVRTKADMIVQPEDAPEELPVITLPVEDLSPSAIAAGIEKIAAEAEASAIEETVQAEEQAEPVAAAEEAEEVPAAEEVVAEETAPEVSGEKPEFMPNAVPAAVGKSTVQIVVRKQQPAVRVTPMMKRVITEPIHAPASEESRRPRLSRSPLGSHLRGSVQEDVDFEQYVRDIALSAVSSEAVGDSAEETAAPRRHFGRYARSSNQEAASPIKLTARAISEAAVQPEPSAEAEVVPVSDETADDAVRSTARKSRYPHNSRMLAGLLAALRRERTAASAPAEESEPELPVAVEDELTEEFEAPVIIEQHDDIKVIRLSDAISERKVSDLQAAVNRFIKLDAPSEPAPRVIRAYGIRR